MSKITIQSVAFSRFLSSSLTFSTVNKFFISKYINQYRTLCTSTLSPDNKASVKSDGIDRELYFDKQVVRLVLNEEKSRNVLSLKLMDTLIKELGEIDTIPEIRAIILAAKGPAFSAGHNLKELVR